MYKRQRFNLGCIGARTTAFKTVRFDEIAMQKHGINVESLDLSELIWKVEHMADDEARVAEKLAHLRAYTDFSKVPEKNAVTLAKISCVLTSTFRTITSTPWRCAAGTSWRPTCACAPASVICL